MAMDRRGTECSTASADIQIVRSGRDIAPAPHGRGTDRAGTHRRGSAPDRATRGLSPNPAASPRR